MITITTLLVALPTLGGVYLTPMYLPPQEERFVTVTAYASTFHQTDQTPWITASNKRVKDGYVAVNGYVFGTKVIFPELYPDKIFEVQDRKNRRYNDGWVDIWMNSTFKAKQFGIKRQVKMLVL